MRVHVDQTNCQPASWPPTGLVQYPDSPENSADWTYIAGVLMHTHQLPCRFLHMFVYNLAKVITC
jgi:hypothetical protein